jgi:hypothetical protein
MDPITEHLQQILQSLHEERRLIQDKLNAATDSVAISVCRLNYINVLKCITDIDKKIQQREMIVRSFL